MNPNDQIETLIKALNDAQHDSDIWQSAYDSVMERYKRLEDEFRRLNDGPDDVKPNVTLSGGDSDE